MFHLPFNTHPLPPHSTSLRYSGRDFKIQISTSALPPGVHAACIVASSSSGTLPSHAPRVLFRVRHRSSCTLLLLMMALVPICYHLFLCKRLNFPAQVPVTVIIPHPLDSSPPTSTPHISRQLDLDAPPHRLWLTPPFGTKAIEVTLTLHDPSEDAPIMVATPFTHAHLSLLNLCLIRRRGCTTTPLTACEIARESSSPLPLAARNRLLIQVGCYCPPCSSSIFFFFGMWSLLFIITVHFPTPITFILNLFPPTSELSCTSHHRSRLRAHVVLHRQGQGHAGSRIPRPECRSLPSTIACSLQRTASTQVQSIVFVFVI